MYVRTPQLGPLAMSRVEPASNSTCRCRESLTVRPPQRACDLQVRKERRTNPRSVAILAQASRESAAFDELEQEPADANDRRARVRGSQFAFPHDPTQRFAASPYI